MDDDDGAGRGDRVWVMTAGGRSQSMDDDDGAGGGDCG